ncbi:MAG: hypothetical protein HGA16_02405 [Candidatus Moranbacteria bacterium]|nr:hypothetical protein [Candidatus Moranbacteria bacterium]
MIFEVPAFGPFKKKTPDISKPEKPFFQMDIPTREQTMRDLLRNPKYQETKADMGTGITVGWEPETYPIEKTGERDDVRDDGILVGEDKPEYLMEQKLGFMKGWCEDLSVEARSIPGISPGRAGNSRYEASTGLLVEWDEEGVRPVWMKTEGSGDTFQKVEIRDLPIIAESFSLSEIESAFDGARDALEYLKRSETIKNGGPKPPAELSETE